jgi:hypothetical protein
VNTPDPNRDLPRFYGKDSSEAKKIGADPLRRLMPQGKAPEKERRRF